MISQLNIRGINLQATGERIKTLRREKGFTVDQLCDIFYISPQAVYKWQKGEALPSLDNMLVLCDVFEVKVEDIVVREDAVSSVFNYKLIQFIEERRDNNFIYQPAQKSEAIDEEYRVI